MTFGCNFLGRSNVMELLRFCNKKNMTVIGGASKLFKKFLKDNPEINEVISYCNISKGKGNLYYNLGMSFVKITKPNYRWVNLKTNEIFPELFLRRAHNSSFHGGSFDCYGFQKHLLGAGIFGRCVGGDADLHIFSHVF